MFDRREFMKYGGKLAAIMGLGESFLPGIVDGLEQLDNAQAPVLWLQAQSCSGCSVSFLNTQDPGPVQVLTKYINLQFHQTISTATGHVAMDVVHGTVDAGGYILAVEGSLPMGMPEACIMGHEPVTDIVEKAARNANAVLAIGTCAAHGGIPAAENNPTGAVSVPAFLKKKGIDTPVISIPGCPSHPDWLVGTIVHVLKFGLPALDEFGRPDMFFSKLVHDQCPRFADYEREKFASHFSDDGCLFELGCLGPITHADCTVRYWNGGANTCINAGAPCVGCASETFAAQSSLSFYLKGVAGKDQGVRS